jgi:signal transduction histidine kinase
MASAPRRRRRWRRRRIRESATKLGSLAADLLTLAQMEAHGPGATAELDLAAIAREAAGEIAGLAEERRVELVLSGGPCHIRGEARWLKRAIENLLSNAVAFSPAGSQVAIDVARRGGLAELLVHDQGHGVAPAVRDRLFRRFVTTRPDTGGTGLGLAIVQAVAESHGGRAELRATGATGSTFALVLPAR